MITIEPVRCGTLDVEKVFWLDEAEPEYVVYDFDNYRYHAGPNVEVGNVYPQAFSRMFYEGQQAAGQAEIVNLVRCAWAGSQRYGRCTRNCEHIGCSHLCA